MDFKTVLAHQYKKLILVALLMIIGFGLYKTYNAFFQKVDTVWKSRYYKDLADVVFLSENRLKEAEFDMQFVCYEPDSFLCKIAREKYEKALSEYEEAMKKKEDIFKTEKQVKSYYDAVILSAQQTPLPFLLLVSTIAAFFVTIFYLLKEFKRG